ncbi:MAG: hypothetical protein ACT4OZ_01525 [Gemmatimonadota bacterium]
MHHTWFTFPLVVAAVAAGTGIMGSSTVRHDETTGHRREVARIQAHFDSVLHELTLTPVLSARAASERRASLIQELRAYRNRGVFPHNRDFAGQAVPYFIDRPTGTLCAVAHLLESTGRRDIVDRVADTDNNVWVAELAGDRAFAEWLDSWGLTLGEAARIQVPYIGDGNPTVGGETGRTYSPAAVGVVAASAGAAAFNLWKNPSGRGRIATAAGLITGAASLGTGLAAMGDPRAARSVSSVSLAVGALSTAIATRGFLRHRTDVAREQSARERKVAIVPIVPVRGRSGAGLSLNLEF